MGRVILLYVADPGLIGEPLVIPLSTAKNKI